MGYKYTEYDSIPNGWQIAFGKQLSKDIKKAGKESRKRLKKHLSWREMLYWEQIKEKWGELCLYASATTEIRAVLDRYELMSSGYCIDCGKHAKYRSKGWVAYLCEECFEKECCYEWDSKLQKHVKMSQNKIDEQKQFCRLTNKDLPKLSTYDNDNGSQEVDIKEKYNIDFSELWDL